MWQDLDQDHPSPSSIAAAPSRASEPSSPRPTVALPSSAIPTDFSARPAYTIGTKSHSYSTDHRKSVSLLQPLSLTPPTTPAYMSESEDSVAGTRTASESGSLATPLSPSAPASPPPSSTSKRSSSLSRNSSLQRPHAIADSPSKGAGLTLLPSGGPASSSLSRHSSLSKKQAKQAERDSAVPPSPSSTHLPGKHVMLNRRSISQDFQLRLQQQQQRQEDLGEELSEAGEDQTPGTPTSVSSFGSGTMTSGERDRDRSLSGRPSRMNRNSVALIESRNTQTLSSNLAMVHSPTDSEFPQQTSDALLSVIAQKEARIAQLREDLETNLSELGQLKERWSQMMMEERSRQQAEASASIQQQEQQLYGHSSSQSVSHRISTTGAGLWGSVVGSVSGISGVSGGISLHQIHALQSPTPSSASASTPNGVTSGRTSTSSTGGRGENGIQSSSRPTSPLPTYLNGLSSLNGLNSTGPSSTSGTGGRRGDRASLSSLSTCSSSQSNAGDHPTAFEAGHSSQSSFSSAGHPDPSSLQMQLHRDQQRESRKMKRESSGLFIPPEAEEVLVNTGRALFKGFGSLIGGIRTVVNDVAESDRFQHSRQRTMDMMSGLAQSAADALPLPSHDDIYYHHQRLRLLDEEEEHQQPTEQQIQQQQQAKEHRRRERLREKERLRQLEKGSDGLVEGGGSSPRSGGVARSPSLVRRTSRQKSLKGTSSKGDQEHSSSTSSLSKTVSLLDIEDENQESNTASKVGMRTSTEGAGGDWELEDKEILESLEADVRRQQQEAARSEETAKSGSALDTPQQQQHHHHQDEDTVSSLPSISLALKKND